MTSFWIHLWTVCCNLSDSCHAKTPYDVECRNKCRVMDVRWGKNKWKCHPIPCSAIPQYY